MDDLLLLVSHWLPLIQGFAALASIAGALLSWKYALKAQRARADMIQNLTSARIIERFSAVLDVLRAFRESAVREDGKSDWRKYEQANQKHKHLFEEIAATAIAASPYLRKKPESWGLLMESLPSATRDPNPSNIEYAAKHMNIVVEGLRVGASTREIAPN